MNKSIYITGIACANLMMAGSMFKVLHWPGANILLVAGVFLFCFFFLPAALLANYRAQKEQGARWLHLITFLVFFMGMISILFKVMHWPGASALLLVSLPLPFVLFLPVYLYHTRNEKKTQHYLAVMFGLVFIAVFSVLLALNVSRNVPDKVVLNIAENDRSAFFDRSVLKNMSPESRVRKRSEELCAYIDELKCAIFTAAGNEVCRDGKPVESYHPGMLDHISDTRASRKVLLGENGKTINTLAEKLEALKQAVVASATAKPELKLLASELFTAKELHEMNDFQLILVTDKLSRIQSHARLIEAETNAEE